MQLSAVQESYPYEIHITVTNADREAFELACQHECVKPVLLELQSSTNGILADAMTSSRLKGTYHEAIMQAGVLSSNLVHIHDLDVARIKIETVPWHPMAKDPSTRGRQQYMESHLQLQLTEDFVATRWDELVKWSKFLHAHLSRNVLKRGTEQGTVIHMLTIRESDSTPEDFDTRVRFAKNCLKDQLGIVVQKTEIEFAVLDTNAAHDGKWMS